MKKYDNTKGKPSKSNNAKLKAKLLEGIGVPEKQEFKVDEFQKLAIKAVANGSDTLVSAPTGSGKTYIAFEAIAVAIGFKKRAVYTTPLKALSNTKYLELKKRFEPEAKVGLLTGDRKIDTDADILVATTEIYRNELYRDLGDYAVVVLDEVHYLSDEQRGPVWEEAIILTPKETTLLMLSASISNADEIAEWLHTVRDKKCEVITKKVRPVELRLGFLDPDKGILPLYEDESKVKVLKDVIDFYGDAPIDPTAKRLKSQKFARKRTSDREWKNNGNNRNNSRKGRR